jgi:hypothetical protein
LRRTPVILLMILITLAWGLMLLAFYSIAAFIVPIEAPPGSSRIIVVVVGVVKVLGGGSILLLWILSYKMLRDFFAKKLLRISPTGSSSSRRHS